ncbi:restriction endonuclease subunit S [Prevotella multiformis]|uniref:Type I restriction modification DNA specificity domain protein n=1 Tax=Prevotella multiformis DSM 16608 TaxID=888743 RepID=F0FA12_9BACT|nr:restriction endonuclease subunit S [Prevotella multiformis]EGC19001.1 type I restriction modification DNA specificity domain protein [Prevotella multiformis DSM 16608]
MKLSQIAEYVEDKISSSQITLEEYVTTDSILQNKQGKAVATNLPPTVCPLTHYLKGDVLVANIRPYLKKVWYANINGGASADVLVFRAKQGNDSTFLYALLLQDSFFAYAMKGAKGSKMPRGDKDQIMRYELPTFTLHEQKNIGKLIIDITNKLSLNRAVNHNLEAMAKQLYDYWFVQFDFPDENGKPYKSSGGKMGWNEKLKREIPQGWKDCKIKDFMRIFTGKKDVSKAVPGNYKFFSCAPEAITSNEYIYDGYAVLVSGNGSYTGRVGFYRGKFDLYQRTYACVLDEEVRNVSFFYYTLRYLFQPIYSGGKHGSSIPYIVLGDLADFRFAFNETICKKFVDTVTPMFDEQLLRLQEIEKLTKQRDELLPLLMNGQVKVGVERSRLNYDLPNNHGILLC